MQEPPSTSPAGERSSGASLRGRLLHPGGALRGVLSVRGLNAVALALEGVPPAQIREGGDSPHVLQVEHIPGTQPLYAVVNGLQGRTLDLTLCSGLTQERATALGMLVEGSPVSTALAQRFLQHTVRQGLSDLEKLLRVFILNLGDHLFDLTASARSTASTRQAYYDALNVLKRRNEDLLAHCMQHLSETFASTEPEINAESDAAAQQRSAEELDLVGLEEMEQRLAIERMINEAMETYSRELECLRLRLGDLSASGANGIRPLFHPAYLCRACLRGLQFLEFRHAVVLESLQCFREQLLRRLASFYQKMNDQLAGFGLRPEQEAELEAAGSVLYAAGHRALRPWPPQTANAHRVHDTPHSAETLPPLPEGESGADELTGADPDAGTAAGPQPPAHTGETPARGQHDDADRSKHQAIYEAVLNALGGTPSRGRAQGVAVEPPAGGAATRQGSEVSGEAVEEAAEKARPAPGAERVLAALAALQKRAADAPADEAAVPLRELLAQHAPSLPELEQSGPLSADTAIPLDFVDSVFSTIRGSAEISESLRVPLQQLRLPVARLAVREPDFFANPEHPARRLLDQVAELASSNQPANRALQRKLSTLLDEVARDYDGDNAVFERALPTLDALQKQQSDALERSIERVVEGLRGQEQLAKARRAVDALCAELMPGPDAPEVVLDLLDHGWRDLLVQIATRDGTESEAWQHQAGLLRRLLATLQAGGDSAQRARLSEGISALGRSLAESQPGNLEHEASASRVRAVLRGDRQSGVRAVPAPAAMPQRPDASRLEQLPRLQRWLRRVDQLEIGTQMRYRDRDGARRRLHLVWISEDREQFGFVNERGQKAAQMSRIQLARRLSQGMSPPARVDRMSVVDQSVYGTLVGAQERLSFARHRDRVTRLINFSSLFRQLQRSVRHAQQHATEHAFLLLDIDSFHLVNEVYDDIDGDQVLLEFARMLAQLNERRSLSARMEQDSFGILLAYRGEGEAVAFADRVRTDISESSLTIAGEEVSFTVTIGVAPIVQSTPSADTVIEQARSALELAKSEGGNQSMAYAIEQEQLLGYQRERERALCELEQALSTDGLVLRAQPIVQSAMDGSEPVSHHYEVLLSVRQPDGSLTSPQRVIADAERFGYMSMLDRWVVREVCSWLSGLMDRQKVIPLLAVNLSGSSLSDDSFLDYVLEQISEFGVGTSRLCFEITEGGAVGNLNKSADFVRTLRNIGCKFSLDNFGTGLSSYTYLRELPVDYVKIDGSFIAGMFDNETDAAMIRSINDLAHFLGQQTIAARVESLEGIEALRGMGVDYLQGWGVGRLRELSVISEDLEAVET